MNTESSGQSGPLLLFDGGCGLCHRVVFSLLRLDRRGVLRFAPLQGATAQAYLQAHGLPARDFSSLVFVRDWPASEARPLLRTEGVIAALQAVGRPGLASLLAAVPRGLRDRGYNFVARVRCRIFGPRRATPLPRPEWAARFLP